MKKEISKEERDGNCESVFVMKRKIKFLKEISLLPVIMSPSLVPRKSRVTLAFLVYVLPPSRAVPRVHSCGITPTTFILILNFY